MTRSRTALGSAAATAALLLSSCSAHAGSAAQVGSTSISESHVDAVARSLCSAQTADPQAGVSTLASRVARDGALSVLLDNAVTRSYADAHGLRPDLAAVSTAVEGNQSTVAGLPASRRAAFSSTLQDYAESHQVLIQVGKAALDKAGTTDATEDQQATEGTKVRDAWAADHVKVSVDPRYGRYRDGQLTYTSGSLSVPASSRARAGAATNPTTGWVSALPTSQQCS